MAFREQAGSFPELHFLLQNGAVSLRLPVQDFGEESVPQWTVPGLAPRMQRVISRWGSIFVG